MILAQLMAGKKAFCKSSWTLSAQGTWGARRQKSSPGLCKPVLLFLEAGHPEARCSGGHLRSWCTRQALERVGFSTANSGGLLPLTFFFNLQPSSFSLLPPTTSCSLVMGSECPSLASHLSPHCPRPHASTRD